MVRFGVALCVLMMAARASHADRVRGAVSVQGFVIRDGGFAEGGVCSIGKIGWSFYACLSIALGYQDIGHGAKVIVTDAGELGARFRAGEHVSFTLGVGSSAISAAIRAGSCIVGATAEEGGDPVECEWTAMPLHIYPALGVHLHAELGGRRMIINVLGRYHLSKRSPEGYVRAPRGPAIGLGVGWEW